MRRLSILFFFYLLLLNTANTQEVSLGAGSYNLSVPTINGTTGGVPRHANGTIAYPKVSSNFNQAIQTNDWWTSLLYKYYNNTTFLWEIHSWKLYAHPLAFVANRYGLDVKYPTAVTVEDFYGWTDAKYQYSTGVQDFTIGLKGMDLGVTDTVKTESYGDWHVKAVWEDASGATLKTTMAHGSPFVYVEKSGVDTAYVRFIYGATIDNALGTNVLGVTIQGHHYGLFAPAGSNWVTNETYQHDKNSLVSGSPNNISRTAFKSDLGGKDYFSIASLPDNSLATLQDYAQYAFAFINDTQVTWSYNESGANLTSTYTISTTIKEGTEGQTLTALYPCLLYTSPSPRDS